MNNLRRLSDLKILLLALLSFVCLPAFSQSDSSMSFQMKVRDPSGSLIDASSVNVRVMILGESQNGVSCVLRDEVFPSTSIEKGYLGLTLGTGNKGALDPNKSFSEIFWNKTTFSGLNCIDSNGAIVGQTSSYIPSDSDGRRFRVSFGYAGDNIVVEFRNKTVSSAVVADRSKDSDKLSGKSVSDFVQIPSGQPNYQSRVNDLVSDSGNAIMSQILGGTYAIPSARVTGLGALATMTVTGTPSASTYLRGDGTWATVSGGGGGSVTSVSGTAPISVATGTSTPVISISDATTSAKGAVQVGSGLSVASGVVSLPDTGTAGTYGSNYQVPVITTDAKGRVTGVTVSSITINGSAITAGTIDEARIPALDASKIGAGTMAKARLPSDVVYNGGTSAVGVGAAAVSSALLSVTSTSSGFLMPRMTASQRDGITSPATGLQVYNTDTNQINYYNGSSWQALGVAGAGISSLIAGAGLTGGTITTSGTIAVDVGTTANKIVQLDGSARLPAVDASQLTGMTASQIPSLDAAKITTGTFAASQIPSLDWSKITTGKPTTISGYGITNAVTNAGSVISMQSGLDASKGSATTAGRLYVATDTSKVYFDDGTQWVQVASNTGTTYTAGTGMTLSGGAFSVSTVPVANGGTGATTPGDARTNLGLGTASTLNAGTSANNLVQLDGSAKIPLALLPTLTASEIPSLDAAKITTGVLPIARGGTNSGTTLNNNRVMISSSGAIVESTAITASRAIASDANGLPVASTTSATELGYLTGVTSAVQTQLNSKASSSGWTNYSVIASNGSGSLTAIPGSSAGQMLNWTVTGPAWTTATFPTSTTANQLLYSSANNVVGGLTTANNAILTTNGSGVPSWTALSGDAFTQYALLAGRSGGQTINGGTAASNNLTLDSTSNATKGNIILNPTGGNVGIGTTSPSDLGGGSGTLLNVQSANTTWASLNLSSNAVNSGTTVGVFGFGTTATASAEKRAAQITGELTAASSTTPSGALKFWTTNAGTITPKMTILSNGDVGIGTTSPTAVLHLKAGTATASTAPLKFTAGTNLTTPEAGAIEFDGTNLYFTDSTNTRRTLATSASASITGVTAGTGLSGGGTSGAVTLNLSNVGTAGTYAKVTTDAQGRVTAGASLAAGDIPNLDAAKITTGTLPIAIGGTNSGTTLNNNRVMISSSGAIVESPAITASRAIASDANGLPVASTTSATELGYLTGVTSAVQTQLNAKASSTGWTNYSVIASNGSGALTAIPGSSAGQMLNWTVTGPAWTTATFPTSTTANQLLYSSANNVVGGLATANNSILTTNGSGVPSWTALSGDAFTQYALLAGRSGGQTINGGTAASNNLTLDSTSNATKGNILLNPTGGNIGVGTVSPTGQIHVNNPNSLGVNAADESVAGRFTQLNGNQNYFDLVHRRHTSGSNWNGTNFRLQRTVDSTKQGFIDFGIDGIASNYGLGFGSGTTTSMVLTASGNLGIGTTNPNNTLQVNGGITMQNSVDNSFVMNHSGTNGNSWSISNIAGVGSAGGLRFYNGTNSTEYMRIGNNGNVGIGTSSPSFPLQINSTGEWPISIRLDTSTSTHRTHILTQRSRSGGAVTSGDTLGGLAMGGKYDSSNFSNGYNGGSEITGYASENWSSTARGSSLAFSTTSVGMTSSSEKMRIDSAGNIGVGTTTPNEKLEIFAASSPAIALHDSGTASFKVGIDEAQSVFKIAAMDNGMGGIGGSFVNNDTQVLSMTTTGRVGLGTVAPTASLHLRAGAATASTAPLKLTAGTNLTTPEAGAIEFDGTNLYFTDSTNTRRTIATSSSGVTGITAGTGLSGGGTSGNVTLNLANVGTAGTYAKVTTDAQGRVTSGATLASSDIPDLDAAKVTTGTFTTSQIPNLDWSKITSGKPTTLSGYGITNGMSNALTSGQVFVGNGSNIATGVAISGDASMTNSGVLTITKIQNRTIASTAPASGQVLGWSGANSRWEPMDAAAAVAAPPAAYANTTTVSTSGSGSWTVPAGVYWVRVRMWGAGGAGGGRTYYTHQGSCYTDNSSGGGGGGAFVDVQMPVTPGSTISYSVGSGGVKHARGSGNCGGHGGNTTFDSYTAGGGRGGCTYSSRTVNSGEGAGDTFGNGGTASTGGNVIQGINGSQGQAYQGCNQGGSGGAGAGVSGYTGGAGGAGGNQSGGSVGTAPGGGGGGGSDSSVEYGESAHPGADGAIGRLIIAWGDAGSSGVATCPSGFSRVGPSGGRGSFCISTAEESSTSYFSAVAACAAKNTSGQGPAKLCTVEDWYVACNSGVDSGQTALTNTTNGNEWVANMFNGSAVVMGNGSCSSQTTSSIGNSQVYRCCFK